MWLKNDYAGRPYFKFEPTAAGFIAKGFVLRRLEEGTWGIFSRGRRSVVGAV